MAPARCFFLSSIPPGVLPASAFLSFPKSTSTSWFVKLRFPPTFFFILPLAHRVLAKIQSSPVVRSCYSRLPLSPFTYSPSILSSRPTFSFLLLKRSHYISCLPVPTYAPSLLFLQFILLELSSYSTPLCSSSLFVWSWSESSGQQIKQRREENAKEE